MLLTQVTNLLKLLEAALDAGAWTPLGETERSMRSDPLPHTACGNPHPYCFRRKTKNLLGSTQFHRANLAYTSLATTTGLAPLSSPNRLASP